MKEQRKKFNLLPPPDDKKAWVLGDANVPFETLVADGNWKKVKISPELQSKRQIETYDCVGYAIASGIEKVHKLKYEIEPNYSDRWLGIIAKTKEKQGNDPHTMCEAIRKYGMIPEEMLPFSDDINGYDEYYSFKGADEKACYEQGRKWLEQYDFRHDWVYRPTAPDDEKRNNIKVCLKASPIPLSLFAWATDARGVYVSAGTQNHLTLGEAFNVFIEVFDSYEPYEKQVDQVPLYAKRIYLAKRTPPTPAQKKSWLEGLIVFLKAFLSPKESEDVIKKLEPILSPTEPKPPTEAQISSTERLIAAVKESIGKDASPENKASKEVGCAESISNLLHSVFPEFPAGVVSTANLFLKLRQSPLFKGVLEPKAGGIVISPRTETINGHVGCFITDTEIVSNDSATGLMKQNYRWNEWIEEFKNKRGLRIYLFQLK